MLAKRFRVNDRKLLLSYYRRSKCIQGSFFKVYQSSPKIDHFMVAVIAYKKYFRRSVERNYLRRIGYSILREEFNNPRFAKIFSRPQLLVITVRPEIAKKNYDQIRQDLLKILSKLGTNQT